MTDDEHVKRKKEGEKRKGKKEGDHLKKIGSQMIYFGESCPNVSVKVIFQ